MKAIRQHRFGGPEVLELEERPDLQPEPDEVRIAVSAAGVHLLDTTIREGRAGGPFPPPELPMTPGREVAGVVDSIGADVDRRWLGRPVVAHLGMASGGYAEQAVTSVGALIELAERTDPSAAVAMVGTGRTALGILEEAAIGSDDVVLVTAAAGGLGNLLVQGATAAGATVVGVAGGAGKVELVETLGVDVAVDYLEDEWGAVVRDRLDGRTVTVALDGVGGAPGRAAFELIGPGGRMVLYGYTAGKPMRLHAEDLFSSGVAVSAAIGPRMMSRPGGIHSLAVQAVAELVAGRLVPVVNPPFPLGCAAAAHRPRRPRHGRKGRPPPVTGLTDARPATCRRAASRRGTTKRPGSAR
jgi:NADPH2:quinone reductase